MDQLLRLGSFALFSIIGLSILFFPAGLLIRAARKESDGIYGYQRYAFWLLTFALLGIYTPVLYPRGMDYRSLDLVLLIPTIILLFIAQNPKRILAAGWMLFAVSIGLQSLLSFYICRTEPILSYLSGPLSVVPTYMGGERYVPYALRSAFLPSVAIANVSIFAMIALARRYLSRKTATIILILLSVLSVFIFVTRGRPSYQYSGSRDSQRQSDIHTTLNAIYQYKLDNNDRFPGTLATAIPGKTYQICQTMDQSVCDPTESILMSSALTGSYIVAMPVDPRVKSIRENPYTGYTLVKDTSGRITISAPRVEVPDHKPFCGPPIIPSVTR